MATPPAAKEVSFGGCNLGKLSPKQEDLSPTTKILNITMSFEDALKFSLAVDECVRKLNSYNKAMAAGKSAALTVAVLLDKEQIMVREGKL